MNKGFNEQAMLGVNGDMLHADRVTYLSVSARLGGLIDRFDDTIAVESQDEIAESVPADATPHELPTDADYPSQTAHLHIPVDELSGVRGLGHIISPGSKQHVEITDDPAVSMMRLPGGQIYLRPKGVYMGDSSASAYRSTLSRRM